jgi:uncharacterized membrane protein YqhA
MRKIQPYFIAVVACLLFTVAAFSQTQQQPVEMADAMRSNGKIYVVVAVLTTILAGLVLYLFRLERKIKQLEKE